MLGARAMLTVLTSINFLLYIDRGALAAVIYLLNDKEKGLGLDDWQSGLAASLFVLGLMLFSPVFAHLSQYWHPYTLMSISVLIWSGAWFLTGVAGNFLILWLARFISGWAEAGIVVLATPVILALAPAEDKTMWISIFNTAICAGIAGGYVYGQTIAESLGSWHWPFIVSGILALPFVLMLFSQRGNQAANLAKGEVPMAKQFFMLLRNKLYIMYWLGYAAYVFCLGGLSVWINNFLIKDFGMNPTNAAMASGGITLGTATIGALVGAAIQDRRLQKYSHMPEDEAVTYRWFESSLMLTVCSLIGLSIGIPGIFITNVVFFLIVLTIVEFVLFLVTGVIHLGTLSSVPEYLRGQAMAGSILFIHLLGDFPSPVLAGTLNDFVGVRFSIGFLVAWMAWAVLFWGLSYRITKSRTRVPEEIGQYIELNAGTNN